MENKIIKSCEFVVENSKNVKIDEKKLIEFCKKFNKKNIKHWWDVAPFNISELSKKEQLMFLFVFNSLSFSYWGNPKWTIEYKGKQITTASFGMIASLGKAFEKGIPILNPDYLSKITEKELEKILEGNVEIPLLKTRTKILNEGGKIIIEEFESNIENLIERSEKDAMKFLELLIKYFPSFQDTRTYKNKKIYFYKRTQLLISDIFQMFKGKDYGNLKNIINLTACADYKIPQFLNKVEIFKYSKELEDKVTNKILIPEGEEMEVELRANTIIAVEKMKNILKNKFPNILSIYINDYLWLEATKIPYSEKTYHFTRTTSY